MPREPRKRRKTTSWLCCRMRAKNRKRRKMTLVKLRKKRAR